MKKNILFALMSLFFLGSATQKATVDNIINKYIDNIGGKDAWYSLTGFKITAEVNQGNILIPVEIVKLKDGRTYTKIIFQDTDIFQSVFDGKNLWNTNFQSLKAEKSDTETTANFKLNLNDFPDALFDYRSKGYTVNLVGKEIIEGTQTYKIKLVKEPLTINGREVDDVVYYYFDTKTMMLVAVDAQVNQGPQTGIIGRNTMSNYKKIDGLHFPFSMTQGVKDGLSQALEVISIEINPQVDESIFTFSEE